MKMKPGDIVYLKSGSPKLIVIEATHGLRVHVAWFPSIYSEPCSASFPEECLTNIMIPLREEE